MSVPVYVAEAAPAHIRGRLVTINQLCITIGILTSSVIAGLFSVNKENGWRRVTTIYDLLFIKLSIEPFHFVWNAGWCLPFTEKPYTCKTVYPSLNFI